MTQEEQIEAIRQRARKNFSKGFNCAECVVEAVVNLVETGLPKGILKLATGFGGAWGFMEIPVAPLQGRFWQLEPSMAEARFRKASQKRHQKWPPRSCMANPVCIGSLTRFPTGSKKNLGVPFVGTSPSHGKKLGFAATMPCTAGRSLLNLQRSPLN